jgi:hypothetical protein
MPTTRKAKRDQDASTAFTDPSLTVQDNDAPARIIEPQKKGKAALSKKGMEAPATKGTKAPATKGKEALTTKQKKAPKEAPTATENIVKSPFRYNFKIN